MGIHGNRSFFLTKRLMLNKIYSYGAFLLLKIVKNRYRWKWVGFLFLRLEKMSQRAAKHATYAKLQMKNKNLKLKPFIAMNDSNTRTRC